MVLDLKPEDVNGRLAGIEATLRAIQRETAERNRHEERRWAEMQSLQKERHEENCKKADATLAQAMKTNGRVNEAEDKIEDLEDFKQKAEGQIDELESVKDKSEGRISVISWGMGIVATVVGGCILAYFVGKITPPVDHDQTWYEYDANHIPEKFCHISEGRPTCIQIQAAIKQQ